MHTSIYLMIFAALVLAPCFMAFLVSESPDSLPDAVVPDEWEQPRTRGLRPTPLQGFCAEQSLSEDFEIRSFAKGISQRRLLVRDTESGERLTIGQVREAATELYKLAGLAAAYEFALVVAATAAAMKSIKNAVAIAARGFIDGIDSAAAWVEWGEAMSREHTETTLWTQAPPKFAPKPLRPVDSGSWLSATQAA